MLEAVLPVAHLDLHLGQNGLHRPGILQADVHAAGAQPHCPVDSPRVHIEKAQLPSQQLGQGGLSRPRGAVDRNAFMVHSFASFPPTAAKPAAYPVDQAI